MIPDVIKQVVFVTGRVLHQGTGEAIAGEVKITAQEGPVSSKVLSDGTFAVSGDLEFLFPSLATQDYQINLTIRAVSAQYREGFAERHRSVMILGGSNFDPDPPVVADLPVDIGIIRMPADPVNIRGRVVEARNPGTPIPGATVRVLQSGPPIPSVTTDRNGRYHFDEIAVRAPAQIQCSAARFTTQPRILLIDYGKLVNEEYFRLAP